MQLSWTVVLADGCKMMAPSWAVKVMQERSRVIKVTEDFTVIIRICQKMRSDENKHTKDGTGWSGVVDSSPHVPVFSWYYSETSLVRLDGRFRGAFCNSPLKVSRKCGAVRVGRQR